MPHHSNRLRRTRSNSANPLCAPHWLLAVTAATLMTLGAPAAAQSSPGLASELPLLAVDSMLRSGVSESAILARVSAAACVHADSSSIASRLAGLGASPALIRAARQKLCSAAASRSPDDGDLLQCDAFQSRACIATVRLLMRQASGTDDLTALGGARSSKPTAKEIRVLSLLRAPCENGDAEACLYLGVQLMRIVGAQGNDGKAIQRAMFYFRGACRRQIAIGCTLAGLTFPRSGAATRDESVLHYFHQACRLGDQSGCWHRAELYRVGGLDVPKDPRMAAELHDTACRAGAGASCALLGDALLGHEDLGLSVDTTEAGSFHERACDLGAIRGCMMLGDMLARREPSARHDTLAVSVLTKACEARDAYSCSWLGILTSTGRGTRRSDHVAARHYTRACDLGEAVACANLGHLVEEGRLGAPDLARAAQLYARSCDMKGAAGCASLGYAYQFGVGVPQDGAKAIDAFEKGCSLGSGWGCWRLSVVLASGELVPKDLQKAEQFSAKACELGETRACRKPPE